MRVVSVLAIVATVAGCDKHVAVAAIDSVPPTPPAAASRSAFISVSELDPVAGSIVTVAGNIGIGDSLSLGSFRARLAYDSKTLTYLDEVSLPGMMRAVNPHTGEIIVAGASADAANDGRLFAFRFRVDDPIGMGSLLLIVDELNDREFASQISGLAISPRLVVDRSLAGKVIPR